MATEVPLCVKLNHTLIATDIVLEALLQLLNQNPLFVFCVPFWRFRGRHYFEERVFSNCNLNIQRFPFRKKVIDFIESHKENGRTIILLDTVYVDYLRLLGGGLKLFDGVLQAESSAGLLSKLQRTYAEGYDLIGSNAGDMRLLEGARLCYLVEPSSAVLAQVRRTAHVETVFKTKRDKIKIFFQTIHIGRAWWLVPVFVPLLFNLKPLFSDISAQNSGILHQLPQLVSAFFLYFIVALGLFILNDIYNIDLLRRQAKKPLNPVAFGLFRLSAGLKLSTFFIVVGVLLSLAWFSGPFNLVLFLFLGLSFCLILAWSRSNILRNILLVMLGGVLILAGHVSLIFSNML